MDKDDKNKEIDVIIEKDNKIYPVEIKSSSIITTKHFCNQSLLAKLNNQNIQPMIVIGTGEFVEKLSDDKVVFPA
jgi:predicted AAA+ superfamily ATPase